MSKKRHTAEEIVTKLREADVLLAKGQSIGEACRQLQISDQTYYKWRKEYGGLQVDQAKRFKDVIEYTSGEPSALSYVIHQALAEAGHGYAAMERAMEEASEERTTTLLRKIELLNVVGNVAPMLGLLGTVYSMIKVFSGIVQAGGMPQPEQLAEGVGIALVTTFWGLIVAIPALAVYAFMRNRIDGLSSEVVMVSQGSISTFRPAPKKD